MSATAKPIVSIIHGARRIGERASDTPSWPHDLAQHLTNQGFITVPFFWDGSVRSGLSTHLAQSYARVLADLTSTHPHRSLSIFGKSIGAIIAEMALRHITKETAVPLKVHSLVRVGCPDLRVPAIPGAQRVFDVRSTGDGLFKATCLPLTMANSVLMHKRLGAPNTYQRFVLGGLAHRELNRNLTLRGLPLSSATLFEVYEKLLSSD